jgi:hypothetical protein
MFAALGATVAVAVTLMPLVTVLLVAPLPPVPPRCEARPPLKTVTAAVWLPGFGSREKPHPKPRLKLPHRMA